MLNIQLNIKKRNLDHITFNTQLYPKERKIKVITIFFFALKIMETNERMFRKYKYNPYSVFKKKILNIYFTIHPLIFIKTVFNVIVATMMTMEDH